MRSHKNKLLCLRRPIDPQDQHPPKQRKERKLSPQDYDDITIEVNVIAKPRPTQLRNIHQIRSKTDHYDSFSQKKNGVQTSPNQPIPASNALNNSKLQKTPFTRQYKHKQVQNIQRSLQSLHQHRQKTEIKGCITQRSQVSTKTKQPHNKKPEQFKLTLHQSKNGKLYHSIEKMDYQYLQDKNKVEKKLNQVYQQLYSANQHIQHLEIEKNEQLSMAHSKIEMLEKQKQEALLTFEKIAEKTAEKVVLPLLINPESVINTKRLQPTNDTSKFFLANILYNESECQEYLVAVLLNQVSRIKRTKLIYKYDVYNKTNIHQYIDGLQHLVFVVRTQGDYLIAAYTESPFERKVKNGIGLIISMTNPRAFDLLPHSQKAITYDPLSVIFGSSELRIKQTELFSTLGLSSGHYSAQGHKCAALFGEGNGNRVHLRQMEVFQIIQ